MVLKNKYEDDEESGHKFIISGGEILELNQQHSECPPDTHIGMFMPKWMRDYRRNLQQTQENIQMTDATSNATTVTPTPAPIVIKAGGFDSKMPEGMSKFLPQILDSKKPDGKPECAIVAKK
jgi:hypothetical protein